MTPADFRSARAALDVARPAVVRLDVEHAPEHASDDLRDAWGATETALRAAVGGSGLSGAGLVTDARSRGLLEYPHAHALLAFQAAADRALSSGYRPTPDDAAAARAGFQALEAALGVGIAADTGLHGAVRRPTPVEGPVSLEQLPPTPPAPPPVIPPASTPPRYTDPGARAIGTDAYPTVPSPAGEARYRDGAPRRGRSTGALVGGLLALVLVVAAGLYWYFGRSTAPPIDQAVAEWKAGQREVARRDFQRIADARPGDALPHVYLARMAREDNDPAAAARELDLATRADPESAPARREVGLLLLQTDHPDRAIEHLRAAVQADPTDRVAMGWLGCALTRVGNVALAQSFFERSGPGDWSACRAETPGTAPAATAPAPAGAAAGTVPAPSYPAPVGRS